MCKFKTPDDEGYDLVVAVIRKFMAQSEVAKSTVSYPQAVLDNPLTGSKEASSKNIYNYGKAVNIANDAIHITSQHNTL